MTLWNAIETAPEAAARFSWRLRFGDDLPKLLPWFLKRTKETAQTVPCPQHCGCIHRVTADGRATCECGDCEDIPLDAADIEVWQTNWGGLGNQVKEAFDLEHKTSRFPFPKVWQVGSFGGDALQIILVVQADRMAFNEAIAQLVAGLKTPFVVLTPTSIHHDIESRELLGRRNAGLHDLESNMTILKSGRLAARKTAGELFSPYLPEIREGHIESESKRGGSDRQPTIRYSFRQAGSMCDIVFDGCQVFHLNNTDGAKYLDYLLRHPSKAIRAFDLEKAVKPDKEKFRDENTIQKAVDPQTKREARQELVSLKAELEEAEANDQTTKVKRLKSEITKVKAVAGNESLIGGDTGERARDNVRKAIKKVIAKLRKGDKDSKAFGVHIGQFVSLGYDVTYNQPQNMSWG